MAGIRCCPEIDSLRWVTWRKFPFVWMRVSADRIPRDRLKAPLPLHLTQQCTQSRRVAPSPNACDTDPPHLINCFRLDRHHEQWNSWKITALYHSNTIFH